MAKGIDWEFIRSEYEETAKPIRAIARENDVSHGAIQRRIKKKSERGFVATTKLYRGTRGWKFRSRYHAC